MLYHPIERREALKLMCAPVIALLAGGVSSASPEADEAREWLELFERIEHNKRTALIKGIWTDQAPLRKRFAELSHKMLCPDVPIVTWDMAMRRPFPTQEERERAFTDRVALAHQQHHRLSCESAEGGRKSVEVLDEITHEHKV